VAASGREAHVFELELSETRSQIEEGEGEATFHWVIARKPQT
jgi:hypothetical protein